MNKEKHSYWFKSKSNGIGWSAPATWQGWLTVFCYLLSIACLGFFLPPSEFTFYWFCLFTVVTGVFLTIVVVKGRRPVKWR